MLVCCLSRISLLFCLLSLPLPRFCLSVYLSSFFLFSLPSSVFLFCLFCLFPSSLSYGPNTTSSTATTTAAPTTVYPLFVTLLRFHFSFKTSVSPSAQIFIYNKVFHVFDTHSPTATTTSFTIFLVVAVVVDGIVVAVTSITPPISVHSAK